VSHALAGLLYRWRRLLTALILIGVAGARDVAVNGFHSEAGWIAFNCVALGFALTAQRVAWFKTATAKPSTQNHLR